MADKIIETLGSIPLRYKDMGDGTYAVAISPAQPISGAAEKLRTVTTFESVADGTGYAKDDELRRIEVVDLTGATAPVVTWINVTKGTAVTPAPLPAHISEVPDAPWVTATSYPPPGAFVTKPEGELLVLSKTLSDGVLQHFYIHKTTGVLTMSTGQNVGQNPAAAVFKSQFIGSFGGDWFADGGDLTLTPADLLAAAVAAGALVRKSDGTSRTAMATDQIVSINIGLKPVGGHVNVGGLKVTTTASDATHDRGGRVYDIDPGGSSSITELRDNAGFLLAANTGDIVVKDGSGVVIGFDIASIPA